jgi:Ca-activated chloride channel family protein
MVEIGFSHPWLLVLGLAPLAVMLLQRRRKLRERGQVPLSTFEWIPAFAESSGTARRIAGLLRFIAMISLVLIAAGVRSGKTVTVGLEPPEAWVIVLDVSSSMTAEDFSPGNRLETAKELLSGFATSHGKVELGLILLAASPRLVVPVTADGRALPLALKTVQPAGFGADGTAIGSGIASAVNRLREGPWKRRRILLVTDGVNNRGALAPADAARLAADLGIVVDTIGIGTDAVLRYWVPTGQDTPLEVKARIRIDDQALEEVSRITGGSYHRVVNAEELKQALTSMQIGAPQTIPGGAVRYDFSWIRILAAVAVLLLFVAFILVRLLYSELPG